MTGLQHTRGYLCSSFCEHMNHAATWIQTRESAQPMRTPYVACLAQHKAAVACTHEDYCTAPARMQGCSA